MTSSSRRYTIPGSDPGQTLTSANPVARRDFLRRGAAIAGAAVSGVVGAAVQVPALAAESVPPWQKVPGIPAGAYGQPSEFEKSVTRHVIRAYPELAPGVGSTLAPIQSFHGTITPSGLHFVRNHNGTPSIDPAQHRLLIHGLVKRPLMFTVAALSRYPTITRTYFIECAGNSGRNLTPQPQQIPAGVLHGLISNTEWTGIPLSLLLEEAGLEPGAAWLLAEGADSASMSRSVPLEKALDDAMIALYQNGERLRPDQGYPVRLFLPGWEGNMNVKWLRRLKVTDGPTHTKDETSKYTDPLRDGKALQFTYEMGVKSVITQPSSGMKLDGYGYHEISGMAWSGAGRIRRVEVSTDGGTTWKDAALHGQQLSKSVARFRLPWEWNGAPAVLQSRATDERGNVQPSREAWLARYAVDARFHNNSIASWELGADGSVKNVYA
ncbi:MAG TPA: sulfite dehydrogenase [Burkholderiales bacterium]|nr:sulfite dehydrogenase [Burkholderiales bacterium]